MELWNFQIWSILYFLHFKHSSFQTFKSDFTKRIQLTFQRVERFSSNTCQIVSPQTKLRQFGYFIESLSSLQVYSLPVRLGRLHQRPLHSCLCLHLIVLDPSSQGASLHLPHPAPVHLYSCWYEPFSMCSCW